MPDFCVSAELCSDLLSYIDSHHGFNGLPRGVPKMTDGMRALLNIPRASPRHDVITEEVRDEVRRLGKVIKKPSTIARLTNLSIGSVQHILSH